MQESLDPLTVSIVEGLSQVVRSALAAPVRDERTPEGVPEIVHLALRVVTLRQELALTEARLEAALRAPMKALVATAPQGMGAAAKRASATRPGPRAAQAKAAKGKRYAGAKTLTDRVATEVEGRTTPFKTDAIVAAVGGQATTVRTMLQRLVTKGVLRKAERGTYVAAGRAAKKAPGRKPKGRRTAPQRREQQRRGGGGSMADRALAHLRQAAEPLATSALASSLRVEVPSLAAALSKLVKEGKVTRVSPGFYAGTGTTPVTGEA